MEKFVLLTSNFGLASTFRSRDRTAALEKHANRLRMG
jgi:hypothetical protein